MTLKSPDPNPLLQNWPLLQRIAAATKGQRRGILLLVVLVVVGTSLPLAVPILIGRIVDDIIGGQSLSSLVWMLVAIPALSLAGVAFSHFAELRSAGVGYRLIEDLQVRIFARIAHMPLGFFTTVRPGTIGSRITNDVYATEPLFTSIVPSALSSATFLVGSAVIVAVIDIRLAAIFAIIPFVLVPIRLAEKRINALLRESFDRNATLASTTESILTRDGMILARQAGQVANETARFRAMAAQYRAVSTAGAALRTVVGSSYDTIFATTLAAVLGVGTWLVTRETMSVGTLLLFLLYVRQVQGPVNTIIGLRYPAIRAGIAFERVFDVLDSEASVEKSSQPAAARAEHGSPVAAAQSPALRLQGVGFEYPPLSEVSIEGLSGTGDVLSIAGFPLTALTGEGGNSRTPAERPQVLQNIELEVWPGEFVAIVGASGAGKSTLAMLAAGLLTPSEGEVMVDGVAVGTMGDVEVARRVALIPQETFVLHDSIAANLRYVNPSASDEELAGACSAARLDGLIASLPQQYETVIGEKGYRLSGGERQRLAIARALLKAPSLLVLDEPTAHLDAETENEVKLAIDNASRDRAVLMIAHRLSTIVDADRILVLAEGRIAESGTHSELLAVPGGRYGALYQSQAQER